MANDQFFFNYWIETGRDEVLQSVGVIISILVCPTPLMSFMICFQLLRREKRDIQLACLDALPEGSTLPQITVIVVQKRHHTRIFRERIPLYDPNVSAHVWMCLRFCVCVCVCVSLCVYVGMKKSARWIASTKSGDTSSKQQHPQCKSVCVCLCVCVCVCAWARARVCVCVCLCVSASGCLYACVCARERVPVCALHLK